MADQTPPQRDPQISLSLPKGPVTRRSMLRGSLIAGAVLTPAAILAACGASSTTSAGGSSTTAAPTATTPTFATLKPIADNKVAFTEIMTDEDEHVKFLLTALGAMARPKPTFKGLEQADIMSFAMVSKVLENTGVGAYLLAAPAIASKDYLKAAGSILTIEARHAGFLDVLLGTPLSANGAFDKPMAQADVVAAASPFIADLNGGADPSKPLGSDLDILNFALLLEYLEKEFYDINVPKFFK